MDGKHMDGKRYVKQIVRHIQCSGFKRKEIEKQLQTEIEDRLQQGEELRDILEQMGSVEEIAGGFNENLSEQERKKHRQEKVYKILAAVVLAVLLAAGYLYYLIPRTAKIEDSKYFVQGRVEEAMRQTIDLWDAEDYEALRELATPRMQELLQEDAMTDVRRQVSEDWGKRRTIGKCYMVEMIQRGKHYAVGEVAVTYEKVKVIYRLTYDEEMHFSGIYIR